jgi:tripartite ATP-independent transporter DctM subunit
MLGIFLIGLFSCIVLTIPIAVSLVVTAVLMMFAGGNDIAPQIIAQNVIKGVDSFPMLAIPFFMIAGEIMNEGGISKRIVGFAQALVGHIRGGVGYVAVLASMMFAGVSGAAVADTTAVGSVLLPVMKKSGYKDADSAALVCSAGCIGPIIPPSIPMIVYGVTCGVSVVKLFMGGFIPGVLIGIGLMTMWYFLTRKKGYQTSAGSSLRQIRNAFYSAIWALLLPVIILGGIITGIVTPTEAAVLAVVYAFIAGKFIYRELKISNMPRIMVNSMKGSASIMFVVGAATAAAHLITIEHIPERLSSAILSISDNVYVVMLLINILLLLVGCVMDATPTVLILSPILLPIVESFGLSPIYFGVILTVNICIGLLTPPVGAVLYVGCGLVKIPILDLVKSLWPYLIIMTIVLFIITYFPAIIMFLPLHFGM